MYPSTSVQGGIKLTKNSENLAIVYDLQTITLGALAQDTAILATGGKIDSARLNGFRVVKQKYWIDWYNKTSSEGPIIVGFQANQTVTQVTETLNADPQSQVADQNDPVTKRPIWPLALVPYKAASNGDNGDGGPQFCGEFIVRWSVPEGQSATYWAFNLGPALTTGTIIKIYTKYYGVWLRD